MCSLALGLAACGGGPTASGVAPEAVVPRSFSEERVWADLEVLAARPRIAGTEGAATARRQLRERLQEAGVASELVETTAALGDTEIGLTHVRVTLPGASNDRFVLVAPYDSGRYEGFEFVGANDGASGAALLVELARVLAVRELPYTVEMVWLEGEGRSGRSEGDPEARWLGSRSLAAVWEEDGSLDGIRLLVVFNRVCDADLEIARDLASHRAHREEFWKSARRLGRSDVFVPTHAFETVTSSHTAFRAAGLRPVVAIEDTVFGGDEAPGLYAENEGDVPAHCAPESLTTVGVVALETVDAIGRRLAKIDRFTRVPTAASADEAAQTSPEPEPAPEEAPAPEEPAPAPEEPPGDA